MPVLIHLRGEFVFVGLVQLVFDLCALILELAHDMLVLERLLLLDPLDLLLLLADVTLQRAVLRLTRLQLVVQVLQHLICLTQLLLVTQVVHTRLLQLTTQVNHLTIHMLLLVLLTLNFIF